MKILFIGGTGTISVAVSKLAVERGFDLTLLNRGQRGVTIDGAETITADIKQPAQVFLVDDLPSTLTLKLWHNPWGQVRGSCG